MKIANRNRTIVTALSTTILAATANADLTVIPNEFAAVEGSTSSSSLFQTGAASVQMYYSAAFLANAGIQVGDTITGVAYRRSGGGTTGPVGETTVTDYNIFLSQSFATPGEMTNTFANNIVGAQTQVHSGDQVFAANSFPGGGTPNAFGPVVDFDTGYVYTGGSMLFEFRRGARTGATTTISTDVDASVATQAGGRWLFNTTGNTAVTGTLSNGTHVFQLQFTPVPEPSTIAAFAIGGLVLLASRRRAK